MSERWIDLLQEYEYIYHISPLANLDSIRVSGLCPSYSQTYRDLPSYFNLKAVFLSTEDRLWEVVQFKQRGWGDQMAVFKVKPDVLRGFTIHIDTTCFYTNGKKEYSPDAELLKKERYVAVKEAMPFHLFQCSQFKYNGDYKQSTVVEIEVRSLLDELQWSV